jgi:heptosyltransferase-2
MKHLKIGFISILLKIQNNILLLEKIIWRSTPAEINDIIIYKNGNIGDIITAYPAIRQIRLQYPNAKILLLTSPGARNLSSSASILKSRDIVDEIIYYYDGKILYLRDKIRKRNFDLCFMMSANRTTFFRELRNLLFFSTLNIKYLRGFYVIRSKFFQKIYAEKIPYPYQNEVERNFENLNIKIPKKNDIFEFSQHKLSNKISDTTKKFNNPLIIATGAKLVSKKWNEDNFFEIAKLWIRNKGDIVFIGNKQDREVADSIIVKLKEWQQRTELMFQSHNYYNFCNIATLDESISLIQCGSAMIANDSGPAHLASFTDTKVVTIQASQDFKLIWDPYFSKDLVLRPNRFSVCKCSAESCGYCINDIKYDHVWEKLKGFG